MSWRFKEERSLYVYHIKSKMLASKREIIRGFSFSGLFNNVEKSHGRIDDVVIEKLGQAEIRENPTKQESFWFL